LKVEFSDLDHFVVTYYDEVCLMNEEAVLLFIKMIGKHLEKVYHYTFIGSYHLLVYWKEKVTILEFEHLSSLGKVDFDVELLLNSSILYEFEDSSYLPGKKWYYQGKYYVNFDDLEDRIDLFEQGKLVYGKKAKEVAEHWVLVGENN
jgi:hypothetical protein